MRKSGIYDLAAMPPARRWVAGGNPPAHFVPDHFRAQSHDHTGLAGGDATDRSRRRPAGDKAMARTILHAKEPLVTLSPGVWLDRLQPGGRRGPADAVLGLMPGGQVWSDSFAVS